MKNISIEFPGVKALSNVDFSVEGGTIHALIGANGAGKSTLMKVLGGVYNHYTGEIFFDDEKVEICHPRDAKKLGIAVVHQEVDTALIPYLNVAENIMLDVMANEMGKKQFVNWKQIRDAARGFLKRVNLDLNVRTLVQDVSLADKQRILVARALAGKSDFIILDEPTAPLSQTETEELFALMRDLAQNQHIGIVFISHRLPEIFEICEHITILRDGEVVADQRVDSLTQKEVIEHMLGRRFSEIFPKSDVEIGETIFEVKNLSEEYGAVKDVSFSVGAGEIVGVTGLVGAGKTELCKTIFGAFPIGAGEIFLKGKQLKIREPHEAVRQGIALVPEERRKEGILVDEPVYINTSASSLHNFCRAFDFIDTKAERKAAIKLIDDLGIRTPSENQKLAFLSGGNQQKVAVGKWLIADAEIYVFDEPTKGVDVGAKNEIFELIGNLASAGKGIIYASSEIPEILGIADRTYVMYDQTIAKELETAKTSEEEILFYSAGGK
ncbi:MAG: sugar ABC transporter ATP-binding protein [Anaerolineae bacterium]|jgi:simple sugar transport system ATP-binding protein|nr:sugar ABC transporter ATP-binding protein [Anaerolineae bacterium]MBT7990651.1 sugar ABC transporter ATP-binding protein [Anaerolineae bacterium]